MTSYIVTYDLRGDPESPDYQPLWDELKRMGGLRTQNSVWLVNSEMNAYGLRTHLQGVMGDKDRIWVCEIVKNHSWDNAMAGTKEWLKQNPPSR